MDKISIEQNILGIVMIHFDLVDKVLSNLVINDFSDKRNQNIYRLFLKLSLDNIKVFDISELYITYPKVIEACGGILYLTDIVNSADIPSHLDSHIKALLKVSTIEAVTSLSTKAAPIFREDFEKGLEYVRLSLDSLLDRMHKDSSVNLYQAFTESINNSKLINVDLGFKSLHNILGYPHPGELLIIGARPGMGKTAFALACLFNYVCNKQKKAVMFSLEMSGSELFQRMISSVSDIPLQDIRAGNLTPKMKEILDSNAKVLASNECLSLYDRTLSTIPALKAAIRKESKTKEVGLVVIDYLQLLTASGGNTYEKVSEISRQLKLLAREFNCTVIALSQLSRKVEERADKRPQLSDLRESGAIEQDADYVLFLYRHNYYEKDPSVDPTKEPLNIEIAKNRHGKTGTVQLEFNLTTGRFSC